MMPHVRGLANTCGGDAAVTLRGRWLQRLLWWRRFFGRRLVPVAARHDARKCPMAEKKISPVADAKQDSNIIFMFRPSDTFGRRGGLLPEEVFGQDFFGKKASPCDERPWRLRGEPIGHTSRCNPCRNDRRSLRRSRA